MWCYRRRTRIGWADGVTYKVSRMYLATIIALNAYDVPMPPPIFPLHHYVIQLPEELPTQRQIPPHTNVPPGVRQDTNVRQLPDELPTQRPILPPTNLVPGVWQDSNERELPDQTDPGQQINFRDLSKQMGGNRDKCRWPNCRVTW